MAIHRHGRQQVARHLEQTRDPRIILTRGILKYGILKYGILRCRSRARVTLPRILARLVREGPESLGFSVFRVGAHFHYRRRFGMAPSRAGPP